MLLVSPCYPIFFFKGTADALRGSQGMPFLLEANSLNSNLFKICKAKVEF